jgi:hypothetical protein
MPARDDTLKIAILDRVIFNSHGKFLVRRIKGGTLGQGPALEYSIYFKAQVKVQARRRMLLHNEVQPPPATTHLGLGFGALVKAALFFIEF